MKKPVQYLILIILLTQNIIQATWYHEITEPITQCRHYTLRKLYILSGLYKKSLTTLKNIIKEKEKRDQKACITRLAQRLIQQEEEILARRRLEKFITEVRKETLSSEYFVSKIPEEPQQMPTIFDLPEIKLLLKYLNEHRKKVAQNKHLMQEQYRLQQTIRLLDFPAELAKHYISAKAFYQPFENTLTISLIEESRQNKKLVKILLVGKQHINDDFTWERIYDYREKTVGMEEKTKRASFQQIISVSKLPADHKSLTAKYTWKQSELSINSILN